jgi:hypothetical protein
MAELVKRYLTIQQTSQVFCNLPANVAREDFIALCKSNNGASYQRVVCIDFDRRLEFIELSTTLFLRNEGET